MAIRTGAVTLDLHLLDAKGSKTMKTKTNVKAGSSGTYVKGG
jgi:hypothetical protein